MTRRHKEQSESEGAAPVGGKTIVGELYLIHTFAFESGNLCARRSETECTAEEWARGRRTWVRRRRSVPVCTRKRHDVAIIIDMLACKRCLLYVCQCAVVVAIFQGRASSLIVPKFGCLSMPEESIDVTWATQAVPSRLFYLCFSWILSNRTWRRIYAVCKCIREKIAHVTS